MRYFLRVAQPVPMSTKEGADSGRAYGSPAVVFFSFICAALMALLYFSGRGFAVMPSVGQVMQCLLILLLLTAAYSGSYRGGLFLPLNTVLMGLVCAGALCLVAEGIREESVTQLYLLPVLLLLVPLHFVMSVSGMQAAALLRCALRRTPEAEKGLQAQNIMMLLAFAASVGATGYIILK